MTKAEAEYLVALFEDVDYCVRRIRGQWCVWQPAADHVVEFDQRTLDFARAEAKAHAAGQRAARAYLDGDSLG